MAFIGMRHFVVARLKDHVPGSEPTYDKGMIGGHAIAGNLTITRNSNPLYGDDVIVEDDNGITEMLLEVGTDDLEEPVRVYSLGLKETDGGDSGAEKEYLDTDESSPYMGAGYIRVRRKNGKTAYQTVWYYKSVFSEEAENSSTKGQSIEWQTPTIRGRVMALDVDGSGARAYRKKAIFATEAEAVAWLDKLANIENASVIAAREGAAAIAAAVSASTTLNAASLKTDALAVSEPVAVKKTAKTSA